MTIATAVWEASGPRVAEVATIGQLLARSELGRSGHAVITQVFDSTHLARLREEALTVHANAIESRVSAPNDLVHGDPDRWLESAPGGPELDRLLRDHVLLDLLHQVTGLSWRPAGPKGSFSYYRREGHHLGLHRDIDACELACISCVEDDCPTERGTSGVLRLYPTRIGEPLRDIRSSPHRGAVDVRLRPGQTIILLGGVVPHLLMPMGPKHLRIVAPLCYQAVR